LSAVLHPCRTRSSRFRTLNGHRDSQSWCSALATAILWPSRSAKSRLGRLRLRTDPEHEEPWRSLAPDALLEPLSRERAADVCRATSACIKALLLDQSKLISGVGNWVADEVLFQAAIHPAARCNTLSDAQMNKLTTALHDVVSVAVGVNADAGAFPGTWLFHHRWGKGGKSNAVPRVPGANGGPISWLTVGGRTSAVVIARQRMGEVRAPAASCQKASKAKAKRKNDTDAEDAVVDDEEGAKPTVARRKRPAVKTAQDEAAELEAPTRGSAKPRAKRQRDASA